MSGIERPKKMVIRGRKPILVTIVLDISLRFSLYLDQWHLHGQGHRKAGAHEKSGNKIK